MNYWPILLHRALHDTVLTKWLFSCLWGFIIGGIGFIMENFTPLLAASLQICGIVSFCMGIALAYYRIKQIRKELRDNE